MGSPCDPRIGCDPDWRCDTPDCGPDARLACAAESFDGPGVCTIDESPTCPPELDPVCGCNGTNYSSPCAAGPNAIDYVGECVADASGP
jgi:hypothetical protein